MFLFQKKFIKFSQIDYKKRASLIFFGVIIVLLLNLFLGQKTFASASTYYVDGTNGNDSNAGTSLAAAFKTIQKAANTVMAGGTVIVQPGTYPERITINSKSGTGDNRIIFQSSVERGAVMHGFSLITSDYITINGFDIINDLYTKWRDGGVWVEDSDYITIENNYIHNIVASACVHYKEGYWPVGGIIRDNTFFRCQFGVLVQGSNHLVENNEIIEPVASAYQSDADYTRFFGNNITFRGNYLHGAKNVDVGGAHVDGFQTWGINNLGAHDVLIENNYVESFDEGVQLREGDPWAEDPSEINEIYNITIRNNVFIGGERGGGTGVTVRGVDDIFIYNNVFKDNINYGVLLANELHSVAGEEKYYYGAAVQNNIFYNSAHGYVISTGAVGTLNGGYNVFSSVTGSTYYDDNDLRSVDPEFINVSNPLGPDGIPFTSDDGFRLQPSSPAIALNAGIDYTSIETPACTESWSCTSWSPAVCSSSGIQSRTCTDLNNCGTIISKPTITQSCTYVAPVCTENWSCTSWSPTSCPSSKTQIRTCTDNNSCNTTNSKPATTQSCAYTSGTSANGGGGAANPSSESTESTPTDTTDETAEAVDTIPGTLVKKQGSSAVYYLGADNKLHVFPTQAIYNSWYNDFSNITVLNYTEFKEYSFGQNVFIRSGAKLIQAVDGETPWNIVNSKVYAISGNGILRHITTAEIADKLFGSVWGSLIVPVVISEFSQYTIGDEIISVDSYNRNNELNDAQSINAVKSLE